MGRLRKGPRVCGPYPHRRRWVIRHFDADGDPTDATYRTKEEAEAEIAKLKKTLEKQGTTISKALDGYQKHMQQKGLKARSVMVALSAVRHFLDEDKFLLDIDARYLQKRIDTRREDGLSVDAVATELRATKTFLRWADDVSLLRWSRALEGVRVIGRRKKGEESKPQLTIDEARAYMDQCRNLARKGELESACAAIAPLLLGLRSREILDREVRDLDHDGRLLWIRRGKTPRASRRIEIPEELRDWMLRLTEDRSPGARIFGEDAGMGRARSSNWLLKLVREVCSGAGVTVVCPHGLRGTYATLAEAAGVASHVVAASLGHTTPEVTGRHYTRRETRQQAKQRRALEVLQGGIR